MPAMRSLRVPWSRFTACGASARAPAHGARFAGGGAAPRDPALAVSAFSAAGEIALSRLADRTGAAADWRRALERDPLDDAMAERLGELLTDSPNPAQLPA